MELIPKNTTLLQRRSCLFHVSQQLPVNTEHFCLQEKQFGHLIIRASSNNKSLASALKKVAGLTLPTTLDSIKKDDFLINWIAPDEFLLLVPENTEFEIETKLRAAITGHFAIANVTGGQTVLSLSGARAESIIKKSSFYDIHLSNFPIGKVVTTNFAKSQVLIRRTGDESFDLVLRRSFSDYLWKWIVDAGSRE